MNSNAAPNNSFKPDRPQLAFHQRSLASACLNGIVGGRLIRALGAYAAESILW
jgi:hypothetical protein